MGILSIWIRARTSAPSQIFVRTSDGKHLVIQFQEGTDDISKIIHDRVTNNSMTATTLLTARPWTAVRRLTMEAQFENMDDFEEEP